MPTYEFRCPKGHDFEKFYRSISAAPIEVFCPECGDLAVRQLSGGAGLVFKGSGFYITDYGKDGKKGDPKPAVKEEGAGAGKTDSTSGTSSDSGSGPSSESSSGSSTDAKPSPSASDSKPATAASEPKTAAKPAPAKSKDEK